jgi:hypothetical protein
MVISSLMINRHIAITCVNMYYELKEEGNNNINIEQFQNSFVKFMVSYIKYTTKFTEEFAERVFKSLYTLDWTDENVCDKEYGFTDNEITRLFLSMKNYKKISNIKNNSDNISLHPKKEEYLLDVEYEENDCVICDIHGYDSNWPEEEKRGNFYYSIPYKLNEPVCHYCVNKEENIEEYIYLKSNGLIKCGNCNNIWDGCAQCNCYMYSEYDDNVDNTIEEEEEEKFVCSLPPNRPVPYPESYNNNKKIEELEERNLELKKENKLLIEEITKIKELMEELIDLMEESIN